MSTPGSTRSTRPGCFVLDTCPASPPSLSPSFLHSSYSSLPLVPWPSNASTHHKTSAHVLPCPECLALQLINSSEHLDLSSSVTESGNLWFFSLGVLILQWSLLSALGNSHSSSKHWFSFGMAWLFICLMALTYQIENSVRTRSLKTPIYHCFPHTTTVPDTLAAHTNASSGLLGETVVYWLLIC